MSEGGSRDAPELPGFYFDRERNRYFRILPGHNNHNPLTLKTIREKKRKLSRTKNDALKKKTRKTQSNKNLVHLLNIRAIDFAMNEKKNEKYFEFRATKTKLRSMIDGQKIEKSKLYSPFGDIVRVIPNKTYERFIFLMKHSETTGSLSLLDLNKSKKACDIARLSPYNVCLASKTDPEILCTSMQLHPTVSLLKLHTNGSREYFQKRLHRGTLFACAASSSSLCRPYLSYSEGKSAVLFSSPHHLVTGSRFIHPRGGVGYSVVRFYNDIMAQCYSDEKLLHFNGLRCGNVVAVDLRGNLQKDHPFSLKPTKRRNVTKIQCLDDGNGLIGSYRNPQQRPVIQLWDVRFPSRFALEYAAAMQSPSTESTLYKFDWNLDPEENYLTSVFPDRKIRLWCVKTGKLLMNYPEVDSVDDDEITTALFSPHWKKHNGFGGMMFYSTKKGFVSLKL